MLLAAERGTALADQTFIGEAPVCEAISSLVDAALRQAGRHALRRVQIAAHESHVILRGSVRRYYHKQLAQHATLSVVGVRSVDNQLTID